MKNCMCVESHSEKLHVCTHERERERNKAGYESKTKLRNWFLRYNDMKQKISLLEQLPWASYKKLRNKWRTHNCTSFLALRENNIISSWDEVQRKVMKKYCRP